jgi:hypothetical protein
MQKFFCLSRTKTSVLNMVCLKPGLNAKAPFLGQKIWGVFAFLGYKTSKLSLRLSIFVVPIADKLREINLFQP